MSDQNVPAVTGDPYPATQIDMWQQPRSPVPALARSPIERPLAAVRRYKWLILLVIALATAGGVAATRLVTPQFEVHASVLITSSDNASEARTGPIRSPGLLSADDWRQLLQSFAISDVVVRKLSLFVHPNDRTSQRFFDGFGLADKVRFGQYELTMDKDRKRWSLTGLPSAALVDSGEVGDSVGKKLGFQFVVPTWAFAGIGQEKVKFTVFTPRETAVSLLTRLSTTRREESDFLLLTFQDTDRDRAARILNLWMNEFVSVASDLKKRKLVEFANTLNGQLQTAKTALEASEIELQRFRVNTITEPSENVGAPIAAGVSDTRDPVYRDFFDKSLAYDNVKQDVQALQQILNHVQKDSIPNDALLQIPTVASGGAGAKPLRDAFDAYYIAQAKLAADTVGLTLEHPMVKADLATIQRLKSQTIPQLARELLASLRSRALDDSVRIAAGAENLQRIPQRTIEEERLRRARDIAAQLYTSLQTRYSEAQLAEASASPDVRVLDSAIAPLAANKNTAARLLMMAIVGGIGAAIGLAILLDKLDQRLRYPEQATEDLNLPIAGTVPRFPKSGVNQNSPEQMFQIVESFRSLRMAVTNASRNGIAVAVTSPSPAEGKSLVSANLAMSFAEAGFRTVLVDGDTRRGALHELVGFSPTPGLTDYLFGKVTKVSDVARTTANDRLILIPAGTRNHRSPEVLTSSRLVDLVAELRSTFDVVVFDTPPLAAGIDGYSIASIVGSLLVVLRVGQTKRRMAAEKLRLFERLPVDIIGGVLNGVSLEGAYSYYGYVPGYEAIDESTKVAVVGEAERTISA